MLYIIDSISELSLKVQSYMYIEVYQLIYTIHYFMFQGKDMHHIRVR